MRISKRSKAKVGGWRGPDCFKPKTCTICGKQFRPNSGSQRVCSKACGLTRLRGNQTTAIQYKRISNNWDRYFLRLAANSRRKSQSEITRSFLLRLLKKQKGRCALSGVKLTCRLKKGVNFQTNASIDRLDIFGGYTRTNVQLVCKCLNSWRGTLPLNDFVWWCKQVSNYSYGKKTKI